MAEGRRWGREGRRSDAEAFRCSGLILLRVLEDVFRELPHFRNAFAIKGPMPTRNGLIH